MFGSSNNNNSSFNFGGTASTNTGSGLFGNSNSNNNNNTFNINNNNNNNSTGTNNANNGGSNLFGNSLTNNATNTGSNLFGNTNNTNANSQGLGTIGKSNTIGQFQNQSSGLFGNSANNSQQQRPQSSGLFGNSNQQQPSSSLFGNSNSNMGNQGSVLGGSNVMNNNNSNIANDPYGMSKLSSTTVKTGDLMPSITEGPKVDNKAFAANVKRKRSSTVGSNSSIPSSPFVTHSTIIKNLTKQMKMRDGRIGNAEDVSGIFSPVRNSLIEKFVPPSTTVGSLKTDKNFKQILASSKLDEIRKLINKRKYGTQYVLDNKESNAIEKQKRRKIINGDGLIADVEKAELLLKAPEPVADAVAIKENEPPHQVLDGSTPVANHHHHLNGSSLAQASPRAPHEDHNGYWCLPSIEDLSKLSTEALRNVEDFIVGRIGFGQVSFNYSVDLTEFEKTLTEELFGGVIRIKEKAVQIYPASYEKPEVGMGLNVPATITLENLAPVDPLTQKPITDPSRPEVQKQVKKLRNLKGMAFVSYDPITGTWIFQVGHFSIWGLVESDNEEDAKAWEKTQKEEDVLAQERSKATFSPIGELTKFHRPHQPVQVGTRSLIEDTFVYKMQKNNDSRPTAVIPGGWSFAPVTSNTSDSSFQSLVHKKPEQRPDTPDIDDSDEIDEQTNRDGQGDILEPQSPFMDEDEIDVEIGSSIVDEKAYEPELDDLDVAALEISPKFATSKDWLEQLALAGGKDSAFNYGPDRKNNADEETGYTISQLDEVLFTDLKSQIKQNEKISEELKLKGKNFASFTATGSIIKKSSTYDYNNMTGVVTIDLKQKLAIGDRRQLKQMVDHLMAKSTIVKRSNGFPSILPNHLLNFETIAAALFGTSNNEEKNFWDLCSRLFDQSRVPEAANFSSPSSKLAESKRKAILSGWLKQNSKDEVQQLLMKNQMDPLDTIFVHIVAGNLVTAAEHAMESNHNHLAVLISLLGSNDSHVAYSCQRQLEEWKKTNALRFIPKTLLKIYLILAEQSLTQNQLRIDVTEGLSWKLCLNMILNYFDTTIIGAIRILENLNAFQLVSDVYFNVFKLSSLTFEVGEYDLASVLDRFGTSSKLDFKRQWLLYEVLVRSTSKLELADASIGDKLTLAFAEQLLQHKLYLESLIILSHIADDSVAKAVFYQFVTRHIFEMIPDLGDLSAKQNLIQKLHIPRALISEAISLRYRYNEDYLNEAEALIEARFWTDADTTVVEHIAPKVIIGDNKEVLTKLGNLISRIRAQNPEDSSVEICIYGNYVELINLVAENKKHDRTVVGLIHYLLDNLSNSSTGKESSGSSSTKIAQTLMSRRIGEIIFDLNSNLIAKEKILSLPMGESELSYFKYKLGSNDDDKDVIVE